MSRARAVLTAGLIAAMVVLTGVMVGSYGYLATSNRSTFQLALAALWVLFAATVVLLHGLPARLTIVLVISGSVALGGAGMIGPPDTSTDAARYAWDGIVQDAGISPYRYVPRADALADLRPAWLFSAPVPDTAGLRCSPHTYLTTTTPSGSALCTAINRPTVPTIYPATSELLFAAVRGLVPPTAQYWPLQLAGLLMSVGVTILLIVGLRRRGLNPAWAALWALGPLTVSEAVTNSHIDVLGSLLTLCAVFAIAQGMRWRGGMLLGAAIAAKLIPVLAAPAVLRRQPWKIILAAVVTFAVLYIPYVATTGFAVIGYLPGYLSEEGYDSGNRFVLLRAFLPALPALIVAAVLLVELVVATIIRSDPAKPWLGQLVVIGGALVIASPPYPWYALLLVPFIVMSGRWEWMAIPAALTVHGLITSTAAFRFALLTAVVIIAAGWVVRAVSAQRGRPGPPLSLRPVG